FFLVYLGLMAFLPISEEDIWGLSGVRSYPRPDCDGRMQDQRADLDTSTPAEPT
ncbi:hypothetical protein P7K49_039394, partial [Saguinus oedipus]